jgi:hypothetical protein
MAVLDDYQAAAANSSEWARQPSEVEVLFLADHSPTSDALVARLRPFDVVWAPATKRRRRHVDLRQGHRPAGLHLGHVTSHGRFTNVGTVFFEQALIDPTRRVAGSQRPTPSVRSAR